MYCPFCGYELPDQAGFCQNCGKRLPKYDETYSERMSESEDIEIGVKPDTRISKRKEISSSKIEPTNSPYSNNSIEPKQDYSTPTIDTPNVKDEVDSNRKTPTYLITFVVAFLVAVALVLGGGILGDSSDDSIYNPGLTNSEYVTKIANAIEPNNPQVRSYALSAIKPQSDGNYNIGQICDIYDKLYKDWVYVNDPSEREYIAPASESVRLLRGDCEDYAILMASLIESIGGTARVIVAYNAAGEGHAYAEVYMTDSNEDVQTLVDNMGERYGYLTVHYHSDYDGGHWLNLDWTSAHPGGEFFDSVGNELVIRSDGSYVTWN